MNNHCLTLPVPWRKQYFINLICLGLLSSTHSTLHPWAENLTFTQWITIVHFTSHSAWLRDGQMNHVEPIRDFLLYYSVWIGSKRTRKLQQGELEAYHHSYYVRKSDKYCVGEREEEEGGEEKTDMRLHLNHLAFLCLKSAPPLDSDWAQVPTLKIANVLTDRFLLAFFSSHTKLLNDLVFPD